jgi:asparagine synthase (glutamine-hydrolysing)
MSAIYGIIDKTGQPLSPLVLQRIKQAIAHRMPGGSNEWTDGNVAFGSGKPVEFTATDHTPFRDDNLVITANAKLHNRPELIRQLELNASQYHSSADAVLILEAFKKWKEDCVHHLDGEYVFAIWNTTAKKLFIASDHIGFKPLYYSDNAQMLVFCSEIKGVEAVNSDENVFDEVSLIDFFFKKGDPERTYNKNIKALCGGNTLLLKNNILQKQKYWQFSPTGKHRFARQQDWYDGLRDVFENAVRKRLDTDANVGITLSGGLDSTSVAGILCNELKKKNKPLYTFSSVLPPGYEGNLSDEQHYIKYFLEQYPNAIPTYVTAEGGSPFKNVPEALERDEVFPNYFHYMDKALCEAATGKQVKLFYSGFGGDFWASYKGNYVVYDMLRSGKLLKALRSIQEISALQNRSLYQTLKTEVLGNAGIIKKMIQQKNWDPKEILNKSLLPYYPLNYITSVTPTMTMFINTGRVSRLAGIFDTRNASFGMATATPFFDKALMEFLADMPAEFLIGKGWKRYHWRAAMEGILPKEIQWRKTKDPYVVDHWKRYDSGLEHVKQRLELTKNDPLINRYINVDECLTLLPGSETKKKATAEAKALRLLLLTIFIISIEYLKKKEYKFH